MTFSTTTLMLDIEHSDGTTYSLTVENAVPSRVRLIIEADQGDGSEPRCQGADLTPDECNALAKVLVNTAELAQANQDAGVEDDERDMPISSLMQWLTEEFGGEVIAIMPSGVEVTTFGETYWAVFESGDQRTIEWVVGLKSVPEAAGPAAYDCPLYFFDLVPVANESWREKCKKFHR
jgi:hypothetical protein